MNTYLLFKSIHLIAVISWMAGLLYLPRIFVYHSEADRDKKSEDLISTFKIMERRLFIYIMNPAMIVSWIFGILLIHSIGINSFGSLWLQLKMFFIVILTIYHFFLLQCLRKFAENRNSYSSKFYRIINEIPTVLLIMIIFVVVFKFICASCLLHIDFPNYLINVRSYIALNHKSNSSTVASVWGRTVNNHWVVKR